MKKSIQRILFLTSLLAFSPFSSEAKISLKEEESEIVRANIQRPLPRLTILERIDRQVAAHQVRYYLNLDAFENPSC